MSYGVLIKNANTNTTYQSDSLTFYPCQRGGISTSDPYYFTTINYTGPYMSVNIAQFSNLISLYSTNTFSYLNFNMNQLNFYGVCNNASKPNIIELCSIYAYETGIGQTVYSSVYGTNSKMIQNFSNPGNIYINSSSGIQTNYFGNALNYARPTFSIQNFIYTKYIDTNVTKYFLAVPNSIAAQIPGNFTWYELPGENFFFNVDFYITVSTFNGISLPLSSFQGIVPLKGQTILVNFGSSLLSGVYSIQNITGQVNLGKSNITHNFPGQTFNITCNLDSSSTLTYIPACYFVSFDYGYPAETFSKNLILLQYTNQIGINSSQYIPLYQDQYTYSSLILCLNTKGTFTKQSDTFNLGIAVSNWFPDSLLFGVGVNYEIKEGF